MQITPFQISIPDFELAALRTRLVQTRWPDPFDAQPWALGTDLNYLRDLVDYWARTYDWRAVEARLNHEPQFVARVGAATLPTDYGPFETVAFETRADARHPVRLGHVLELS